MVKKRVIALLILKNNLVIQSIGFKKYLPVGCPIIQVEFLTNWGVDEIVILDIDATQEHRPPNYELVEKIASKCFVPLTVGGGIREVDHVRHLIRRGADKVCINSALDDHDLISAAVSDFGAQCIVASLDAAWNQDKQNYYAYNYQQRIITQKTVEEQLDFVAHLGVGEVFLNSVHRDGAGIGLDLQLIKRALGKSSLPIIAAGGVGAPKHVLEGFNAGNLSAIAIGNYLHFREHCATKIKAYLKLESCWVRPNNHFEYDSKVISQDEIIRNCSTLKIDV